MISDAPGFRPQKESKTALPAPRKARPKKGVQPTSPDAAASPESNACVAVAVQPRGDLEVVPVSNAEIVKEGAAWHATAREVQRKAARRLNTIPIPTRISDLRTWIAMFGEHVKTGMALYGIGNGEQQQSVSGGISGHRRVLDVEVEDVPLKQLNKELAK